LSSDENLKINVHFSWENQLDLSLHWFSRACHVHWEERRHLFGCQIQDLFGFESKVGFRELHGVSCMLVDLNDHEFACASLKRGCVRFMSPWHATEAEGRRGLARSLLANELRTPRTKWLVMSLATNKQTNKQQQQQQQQQQPNHHMTDKTSPSVSLSLLSLSLSLCTQHSPAS
jgi:hypothetical protein